MFVTYQCRVRLSGSLHNEVPRYGLTAPEMHILQFLHGDDALIDIRRDGQQSYASDADERERLNAVYGRAFAEHKEIKSVAMLFGIGNELPKFFKTDAVAEGQEEDRPLSVGRRKPYRKTVLTPPKPPASKAEPANTVPPAPPAQDALSELM